MYVRDKGVNIYSIVDLTDDVQSIFINKQNYIIEN